MKLLIDSNGAGYFYCPGCNCMHYINIYSQEQPRWQWNGDLALPTVRPAIVYRSGTYADPNWQGIGSTLCESRITDGIIEFRDTSTHHLKGSKIELPEIPKKSSEKIW